MVPDRLGGPGADRRVYSLEMYLIRESSFCKCVSCGAGQVWEVSAKAQGQRKVLKEGGETQTSQGREEVCVSLRFLYSFPCDAWTRTQKAPAQCSDTCPWASFPCAHSWRGGLFW